MALTLDHKHQMNISVLDNRAVVSHLRQVLSAYVNNPHYSKFYIGITSDLNERRASHAREKPHFKMMCPIYGESNPKSDMAFHSLEKDAINALRQGIVNPSDPSKKMICDNVPGGSSPKNWLYILLG